MLQPLQDLLGREYVMPNGEYIGTLLAPAHRTPDKAKHPAFRWRRLWESALNANQPDAFEPANLDLRGRSLPGYIAVEGPIGVGKTTLARRLAQTFNYQVLLEDAHENPFLERFYQNRREAALATQLFFLFQRSQKIADLRQSDIFEPVRVSDFLIDKDPLFARINLDSDEYTLYEKESWHRPSTLRYPIW